MKRIINLCLVICCFTFIFGFSALAASPRVVDNNDLLTAQEEEELTQRANAIAEKYKMDVVIVTQEDLGGKSAKNYAADFYDYNDYGIGSSKDGIQFLVSTGERDRFLLTTGRAANIFNDYTLDYINHYAVPYLSDGDFHKAFSSYLDSVDRLLSDYTTTGTVYDNDNRIDGFKQNGFSTATKVLIAALGGLLIGFIIVFVLKGKLKTAVPQPYAGNYVSNFNLNRSNDMYLYSHTTAVKKADDSNKGGSSTFTGSSGTSHGGSGGKF